jgi:hypothetical protein
MVSLDFSIDLTLPAALWLRGRYLPGGKERLERKADNLTANFEPIV